METRLLIAFGIIGMVAVIGTIWSGVALRRRKRRKLRLRGVKTYGH